MKQILDNGVPRRSVCWINRVDFGAVNGRSVRSGKRSVVSCCRKKNNSLGSVSQAQTDWRVHGREPAPSIIDQTGIIKYAKDRSKKE